MTTLDDRAAALVALADDLERVLIEARPLVAAHLDAVAALPQDARHGEAWFALCDEDGFAAFVSAVSRLANASLRASIDLPRPLYERRRVRSQAPMFPT